MKNNCEIVNQTICKKCFQKHKEKTEKEPINCAFKAFDNEYCEEAQKLADYVAGLQLQLDQQKAMSEKLKKRVCKKFNEEENCNAAIAYRKVFTYMQELEKGEKDG